MKPLAVYKLSKVESAVRRLEAALDRLDQASASAPAEQEAVVDTAEMDALRQKCNDLTESLRAASLGVDVTVSRLKLLLGD